MDMTEREQMREEILEEFRESGRRGGKQRWARISQGEREKWGRKMARRRWGKRVGDAEIEGD